MRMGIWKQQRQKTETVKPKCETESHRNLLIYFIISLALAPVQ